ncbi:MAG TPA: SH3 domain-containing protein [Aggregatilineales bacterium]|nr:SH3 domain-containing protein [Anaerolineales bacterium]HRE49394.1 SH3 domain-containing protein [Aggregatilineales bacterium]
MSRSSKISTLVLVAVLAITLVPQASPAHAISAALGRFWANCGIFSVDTAVNGTINDSNNTDRFRYRITDGNGKKLYQEDAQRTVGVTTGSLVVNMSFDADGADGPPGKNPIRFDVIELDVNGFEIGILQTGSYDAQCLPPSGTATFSADFRPPTFLKVVFSAPSALYTSPAGATVPGLTIAAGKEHVALYRSADNGWVMIDVGGNELVWVPVGVLSVDLTKLGTPPARIDGADPSRPGSSVVVVPTPGGPVTVIVPPSPPVLLPDGTLAAGVTRVNLRMRTAPAISGLRLATIPKNTIVAVYGRNDNATWYKVQYGIQFGWVAAGYLRLTNIQVANLPVVFQ